MLEANVVADLVLVKFEGEVRVGKLSKLEDGNAKLEDSIPWHGMGSMKEWVQRKNLGTLETVMLSSCASYAISPFNDDQKIAIERTLQNFNRAARDAMAKLECDMFERMFDGDF